MSESTQHQKAYSRELPCGDYQQRRKTASPTASPLNRPSEPTRTTPPPRAPSSSTQPRPPPQVDSCQVSSQDSSKHHATETPTTQGPASRRKARRPRQGVQPPTRRPLPSTVNSPGRPTPAPAPSRLSAAQTQAQDDGAPEKRLREPSFNL